jgi:hypothetical protein
LFDGVLDHFLGPLFQLRKDLSLFVMLLGTSVYFSVMMDLDQILDLTFDVSLVISLLFLTLKILMDQLFLRWTLEIVIRSLILVDTEVESGNVTCHQALAIVIVLRQLAETGHSLYL